MTKNKIIKLILCLLPIATLVSCDFWQEELTLHLSLPPLPAIYDCPLEGWEVEVLYEDLRSDSFFVSGNSRSFTIHKRREETLCITGRAVLVPGISLRPAGLLHNGREGDCLRFEDGPALDVLWEIALKGYPLSRFNCSRFIEELDTRRDKSAWFWDLDPLVETIVQGEFSLVKLHSLPLFPIALNWTDEVWVSEDPAIGLVSEVIPELPPGQHRFFSLSSHKIRDVTVDEEGACLFFDSESSF